MTWQDKCEKNTKGTDIMDEIGLKIKESVQQYGPEILFIR